MARKCNHCGECCKLLVQHRGHYLRLGIYCPAHNPKTHRCIIYNKRQNISKIVPNLTCNTAEDMISKRLQPSGCAYTHKHYRSIAHNVYDMDDTAIAEIQAEMDSYKQTIEEYANGNTNQT